MTFYLLIPILLNLVITIIFVRRMHIRESKEHNKLLFNWKSISKNKEISTAWQNANDNINFNKNLQWNITYYGLLVFGAIIFLSNQFKDIVFMEYILYILSNITFVVSVYIGWHIQHQIRRERISILFCQFGISSDKIERTNLLGRLDDAMNLFMHPMITITVFVTIILGYSISIFQIIYILHE